MYNDRILNQDAQAEIESLIGVGNLQTYARWDAAEQYWVVTNA